MAYKHRVRVRLTAMVVLFAVCFFGSFMLGRYPIEPWTLIRVLASRVIPVTPDWPSQVETVLFNVRLPRVLMAALIGAGLAAAGAAYQGFLNIP